MPFEPWNWKLGRLAAAGVIAVSVVSAVTIPVLSYLDHLESEGKLAMPDWLAKPIAILIVGLALLVMKVALSVMNRRWPEQ